MSVWDELVGQEPVVESLREVVADPSRMTHAWLFTGPPGSGRSNAARAMAAALQCETGGCGHCDACTMSTAGTHPDITVIRTDGLSIGVDIAREYVRKAALRPALGRWQILIVEDADRLTDQAANALLKAIEEPAPKSVWMLCATAVEDVMITVRSRCRPVLMRTPPVNAIAGLLVSRDGIDEGAARAAASASQGHIGRAKVLASDERARQRRRDILDIPLRVNSLGECLAAAQQIVDEAGARASEVADSADESEVAGLKESWGVEDRGRKPAGFAGAMSALAKDQDRRRKRLARDAIDGVLIDLLAYCRDVIAAQIAPDSDLVNSDVADDIAEAAATWTPESTLRRIDAIVECREALEANAAPQLALERMMTQFLD
jgi:DNA polymerase-3 subunit delta'